MDIKKKIDRVVEGVKERARAAWAFVRAHPVKTAAAVLGSVAGVALVVMLLSMIVSMLNATAQAVALFLDRYFVGLLLFVALAVWLKNWRVKRREERDERKRLAQEQERAHRVQEYERTKEATYTKGGKMVFNVVRNMGSTGIVPPMQLSDIYSPGRTIPIDGGAAMLCLYLLQKAHEVDTDQFMNILQTKIDQRLSAGEWPGVEAQHFYDGRVYSGFTIHQVRESPGGYLEVYAAFVNDAYCHYAQEQELDKNAPPPLVDRRDMDY